MPIGNFTFTTILVTLGLTCVATGQQVSEKFQIPTQSPPAISPEIDDETRLLSINQNTNLVSLLDEIRKLSANENYTLAEKMAKEALSQINQTNQNKFYLKQIRKEETNLFYQQAQVAFKNKDYSLASQFLERYRENVALELSERKIERENFYAAKRSKVRQKTQHLLAGWLKSWIRPKKT